MSKFITSISMLLAVGLFPAVVQANTIDFEVSFQGNIDSVDCTPSCRGLFGGDAINGGGSWDSSSASVYDKKAIGASSSPGAELALLNSILGLTGTSDAIEGSFSSGSEFGEASSFVGMEYEYWAIKKGQDIAFFKNDGSQPVDFSWSGDDWSHTTGFGAKVSVVPLPAAAWLFGSAMLGMAGIGFRRKSKTA